MDISTTTTFQGRKAEESCGLRQRCSSEKTCVALPVQTDCTTETTPNSHQMALYFPNIAGTALTGEKVNTTELLEGKTSLVAILNTRLSEVCGVATVFVCTWTDSRNMSTALCERRLRTRKEMATSILFKCVCPPLPGHCSRPR